MAKCANCVNEAFVAYQVTSSFSIPYCSKHTPKFLGSGVSATRLVKISETSSSSKTSKKKKEAATQVIEDSVVDELLFEEPAVEYTPEEVVETVVEESTVDEFTPEVTEAE